MAQSDQDRLTLERFDYSRVGAEWTVARLVAALDPSLTPAPRAELLIRPGLDAEPLAFPARLVSTERRLIGRGGRRSGRGGSELLWRAAFAIPFSVIEAPEALFALSDGGELALALTAPTLRVITPRRLALAPPRPAASAGYSLIAIGHARQRAIALATAVVVTTTSSPAIALAADGSTTATTGATSASASTGSTSTASAATSSTPVAASAPTNASTVAAPSAPSAPAAVSPAPVSPAAVSPAATPAPASTTGTVAAPAAPDTAAPASTSSPAPASTSSPAPASTSSPAPASTTTTTTPAATTTTTTTTAPSASTPPAPSASGSGGSAPVAAAGSGTIAPAAGSGTVAPATGSGTVVSATTSPAPAGTITVRRSRSGRLTATTVVTTSPAGARHDRPGRPGAPRVRHFSPPAPRAAASRHHRASREHPRVSCTTGGVLIAAATSHSASWVIGGRSSTPASLGCTPVGVPVRAAHHDRHHTTTTAGSRPLRSHSSGGASLAAAPVPAPTTPAAPDPTPSGSGSVSVLSSTPAFSVPNTWTGTVAADPSLIGAVQDLSGLLSDADRPPSFLVPIYMQAGRHYDVPWEVLAAINSIESDYGRDLNTSSAGAVGWMQFEPGTWREYGVAADGHRVPNPYDPRDAIFSAARYLAAAGAARDLRGAVFAYNHATWYVDEVLARAQAIATHVQFERQKVKHGVFSVYFATGSRRHRRTVRYSGGVLSHFDRVIATANMVSSANFPYLWGGGHEQPARFGPFDCSGAVSYVMQQAGYRVPTSVSGDIGQWHFPTGPGRVTIFYNAVHTFMRIGNRYFGTSGFARPGGGAGWFDVNRLPSSYLAEFNEVHVPHLGDDSFAPVRPAHGWRHLPS